jgi:hypothetical protein
MKTTPFLLFLVASALGLAVFCTVGFADKETQTENPSPTGNVVATTTATTSVSGPSTADGSNINPPQWANIEGFTYEMKAQCLDDLKTLEAELASQISRLTAKRAAMKSTTDTKEWNLAMKEMENAEDYLKFTVAKLGHATPETWEQEKEKVHQAWLRTQEAYAKVNSSTTD